MLIFHPSNSATCCFPSIYFNKSGFRASPTLPSGQHGMSARSCLLLLEKKKTKLDYALDQPNQKYGEKDHNKPSLYFPYSTLYVICYIKTHRSRGLSKHCQEYSRPQDTLLWRQTRLRQLCFFVFTISRWVNPVWLVLASVFCGAERKSLYNILLLKMALLKA